MKTKTNTTDLRWIYVTKCPACLSTDFHNRGRIPNNRYVFGNKVIHYPSGGIAIAECERCNLLFKTTIPTQKYLKKIFDAESSNVWNENHSFENEMRLIYHFTNKKKFDLLDVGCSNGALLKTFPSQTGRLSGLDIVKHKNLEKLVTGEYIQGFLDDKSLTWSAIPYDVITIYDVFEHFYAPKNAFHNLKNLIKKNGIVIIETGNANSYYPQKYGINRWWYTSLFEHHISWQPKTVAFYAKKYGFKVLFEQNIRHKAWRYRPIIFKTRQLINLLFWYSFPGKYHQIANKHNIKHSTVPWSPLAKDHFLTVIQMC